MGAIRVLLEADHARLDALLARALGDGEAFDAAAFWELRSQLLRHIGMEERILFPAARSARGGQAFAWARRLREDHGRIASLLVPTPDAGRARELAALLHAHDALEEGEGGAYAECEAALAAAGRESEVLARLERAPTPPPAPYFDGPRRATPRP